MPDRRLRSRLTSRAATTTTVDLDRGLVTVRAHRFEWVDLLAVREEAMRHLSASAVRVDLSEMTDADVSGLWASTLVRANRKARHTGHELLVVAPPPRLAALLARLGVPHAAP